MNRYIFAILFSLVFLTGCTLPTSVGRTTDTHTTTSSKYDASLTEEERITLIRDRRTELDSLRKGDYFALRNNPDEALTYYLSVAEKLPDDVLIRKKIGHAYYLKKDWKNAYGAYVQTPIAELSVEERREMLQSLFLDEAQVDRIGELNKIQTNTGEQEYYQKIDICYTGIHNCIVSIESYTGTHADISALRSMIQDATKISPDYQYRNFLVATRLYEYGAYRASVVLSREILQNRPDYAGVEKLLGFALSEIGNATDAQRYLLAYLEKNPQDLEVMVKLGDIAFLENDSRTATIYYNNAVLAGYTPKTDVERKLAYSYSRLADVGGMMRVLAYLLEESDATEDDAAVAISLALENGENLKAYVWANNATKKYPKSPIIAALYLTSMRTIGKTQDASVYLQTLPDTIRNTPIVLLEAGILSLDTGAYTDALGLFEQVRRMDTTADFAYEAENYIQLIHDQGAGSGMTVDEGDSWWR